MTAVYRMASLSAHLLKPFRGFEDKKGSLAWHCIGVANKVAIVCMHFLF